jgi:hypothetical protein
VAVSDFRSRMATRPDSSTFADSRRSNVIDFPRDLLTVPCPPWATGLEVFLLDTRGWPPTAALRNDGGAAGSKFEWHESVTRPSLVQRITTGIEIERAADVLTPGVQVSGLAAASTQCRAASIGEARTCQALISTQPSLQPCTSVSRSWSEGEAMNST